MFGNISGPTLLVILFIVLLLFGAPKLPALARSLGQSMKILKKEVTTSDADKANGEAADTAKTEAEAKPGAAVAAENAPNVEDELARAKAEAEAAKAEAEALRAAAEKRETEKGDS